ncbi:hypothetical protein NVP1031O_103 [Vibrio phage 1.031.O._10N.261.46.F8]|nr:hypothetical protein NVP1031O_103 [Vibrio phage 1.031.O._10N.261.46.F8]
MEMVSPSIRSGVDHSLESSHNHVRSICYNIFGYSSSNILEYILSSTPGTINTFVTKYKRAGTSRGGVGKSVGTYSYDVPDEVLAALHTVSRNYRDELKFLL